MVETETVRVSTERGMVDDFRDVLVVEDSASEARLIDRLLRKRDAVAGRAGLVRWNVVTVGTLADALKVLISKRFATILLDLGLPDSEGLDTLRRVRAVVGCEPVVVVLSARESIDTALAAIEQGADDYVPKSLLSGELLHRVLAYSLERKSLKKMLADSQRGVRVVAAAPTASAQPMPMCEGLTRREVEVLRSVASGRTKKEIASEMKLSPRTVERHVSNVMQKVKLHDRVSLARYAIREGLIDA